MSRIAHVHYRQAARPLRMVFGTALGRKSTATSVLVRVGLDDGASGLGEAPTSFVAPHETPEAIKDVLRASRRILRGAPLEEGGHLLAGLRARFGRFHMTLAGLEMALFRAGLAARGQGEWAWWGGRSRCVETDITVPFMTGRDDLARWIARAARVGFGTYKVKVSGQVETDLAFVRAVEALLQGSGRAFSIRLDGNQGYTADGCLRMLDGLRRRGPRIELFEQPVRKDDLAGLKLLRAHSGVPIILDETVFTPDDCRRAIAERLGDGVNVKVAKSGIEGSAAILRLAAGAGMKVMIGCMTETMVGLSAGILMAAGTAAYDYADLDAAHLLYAAAPRAGLRIDGPRYVVEGAA